MRYRILAVVVALMALGGFLVTTAQQAGASSEFSVVSHETNFEYVPANGPATAMPSDNLVPSIGDRAILRDDLMQGNTTIGYDNIICSDTYNNNALCDAVFSITGKGDIHATALVRGLFDFSTNGPAVFDASIDGGTFAYANARGDIHIVNLPSGDSQNNFFIN